MRMRMKLYAGGVPYLILVWSLLASSSGSSVQANAAPAADADHEFTDQPADWEGFASGAAAESGADAAAQVRLTEAYGKLPVHFEVNRGQTDARVKFLARGAGYTLFLTPTDAVLVLSKPRPGRPGERPGAKGRGGWQQRTPAVVRMTVRGANRAPRVTGEEELAGTANYLTGNDPAQWRTNVPTYARVHYHEIYPGIDLIYHGKQRRLEYDFVVSPGVDPARIVLGFDGADRLELDAAGDLVVHTPAGSLRQQRPFIYQEVEGSLRTIAGGYVLRRGQEVAFHVGPHDRTRPLVIDPVLVYSTYLGGSGGDVGLGVAVEGGRAYVTGNTTSADFPTTPGSFDETFNGGFEDGDAFVAKLNRTGTALVYSTYVGGSGDDRGAAIAVQGGRAYVTGATTSADFPTTPGAFDTTFNGGFTDGFVTKLNRTGSALLYSTYLGGNSSEQALGIAVDGAGRAHVTGFTDSPDFPTTPGAFDETSNGGGDAFATKLNQTGSTLVYSTYLGGSDADGGLGIAVDGAGRASVAGFAGPGFPTTPGAFDTTFNGGFGDGFVSKLTRSGSELVYSTYIGGSGFDAGQGIALDGAGSAYAVGTTDSTDFPTTPGAFDTTFNGGTPFGDGFITKLEPSGSSLAYSTYLGGSGNEDGNGIAVDGARRAHVTGLTRSADFPTTSGAIDTTSNGGSDAFVTELSRTGSELVYSTYLGGSSFDRGQGIAVDGVGRAYVTGFTGAADFPTTPGAFDTTFDGGADVFITKFGPSAHSEDDEDEFDDDEDRSDDEAAHDGSPDEELPRVGRIVER